MSTQRLAAHDAILQHPQQSRLLWHDLVKYSAIERAYIDNLYHNVYGSLSRGVRESLGELEVVVALQSLWVENMSTLAKLEVAGINSIPTAVELEQLWHQAVSLVEPILRHQRVTLDINYKKEKANIDERYYMLAVRNVLVIASYLAIPGSTVHVQISKVKKMRCVELTAVTSINNAWPIKWLDMASDNAAEPWNHIWFFGHMSSLLSERWGGSCRLRHAGKNFNLTLTM